MNIKICCQCKIEKPLSEFNKNKNTKDSHDFACKLCKKSYRDKHKKEIAEHNKIYREENQDKLKQKDKEKYQRRKEIVRIKGKEYRETNKEKIASRTKQYREKHKDEIKIRKALDYQKNKDKRSIAKKLWAQNNKEKMNARRREREKTDPHVKMSKKIRQQMRRAIVYYNATKKESSLKYLGCDMAFFVKHIEAQWIEGMNWSNHGNGKGKWQVDHIDPICSFDFSKDEQLRACFHYSNLRPLWQPDNARKGAQDKKKKFIPKLEIQCNNICIQEDADLL